MGRASRVAAVTLAIAWDAALTWVDEAFPKIVDSHYGLFSTVTILAIAYTVFAVGWAASPRSERRNRAPFLGY